MHPVRILAEKRNPSASIADAATGSNPFWWRGSDVVFQFALTDNGTHLLASDITQIIVEVKDLSAGPADPPRMLKTYGTVDCDATFTAADWEGGSKQLLSASFTPAESALLPGTYRIIIRHVDLSGFKDTFLSAQIEVREDHSESMTIDPPPAIPLEFYTKTEANDYFSTKTEVADFVESYGTLYLFEEPTTDDIGLVAIVSIPDESVEQFGYCYYTGTYWHLITRDGGDLSGFRSADVAYADAPTPDQATGWTAFGAGGDVEVSASGTGIVLSGSYTPVYASTIPRVNPQSGYNAYDSRPQTVTRWQNLAPSGEVPVWEIDADFTDDIQTALQPRGVDVRTFGVQTGTVSGAVRIQNRDLIQDLLDTGYHVFFPSAEVQIFGDLRPKCSGQIIFGETQTRSVIRQFDVDSGHFHFVANDDAAFPNNPPGGSAGQMANLTIERLFLVAASPSAQAGITHDLPDPETGLYPSGLAWLEDNLRLRDLWIEGYSLDGGRGIDLYSCAKIYPDRIIVKNCDIGYKIHGGSSNCQHWHGLSFHKCRLGFWGQNMTGSTISISDTASSDLALECKFKMIDSQVTIIGGEIEFNDSTDCRVATFLDAQGGDYNLINQRALMATLSHPIIVARTLRTVATSTAAIGATCTTKVHLSNFYRTGHTAGTPLAISGGPNATIIGANLADFKSSNLASTVNDNAFQSLSWAPGAVKQVETAVAVGTIATSGSLDVTVTSARMFGSPRTIAVPVESGDVDTVWAGKVRDALLADYHVVQAFTPGGAGANMSLTETIQNANDSTLNLAIANGTATGITEVVTSTNTTAGVAGRTVRINSFPWIDTAWTTPEANMLGLIFNVPSGSVTQPGGDMWTVVQDIRTNQGTGTQYRWASLTRANFSTFNVVSSGAGVHFGAPDVVLLTHNSTTINFPLNATTSSGYRAALRGGYLLTIKNRSTISHNIAGNGSDTFDGAAGPLAIAAGATVRLFTIGDGNWLTL